MIERLSVALLDCDEYNAQSAIAGAEEASADFVMIGPEAPIANGVVNELQAAGFEVCGPTREASRIEWDKAFMRRFLEAHLPELNVPYAVVTTQEDVARFFRSPPWPMAVKPNGLTGGKGVRVLGKQLHSNDDAAVYALDCLEMREPVVIEQRMDGVEFTLHCVTDGVHHVFFRATYDYSYRNEQDRGLQTGGMGSYCDRVSPLPFMTSREYDEACEVLRRVLDALAKEGTSYKGVFQGQFFMTSAGLKICEFACRFGDPEAMNLLPILEPSWTAVMEAVQHQSLRNGQLETQPLSSVALCLVPPLYPQETSGECRFTVDMSQLSARDVQFLPAACEWDGMHYRGTGGRCAVLLGNATTIQAARNRIMSAVNGVSGLRYREDIASDADIKLQVDRARSFRIASGAEPQEEL
jgi:phosphoribosylamine--glycine ligase